MSEREIEVAIVDGDAPVQRCVCTLCALPDGSAGVLWRGVVYPLLPGNRVDVNDAAPEAEPEATPGRRFAVLPGDEASWVLVQGVQAARTEAQAALEAGGVVVSRSGRWLGEPVGDEAFDWFLRCDGALDETLVGRLLAAAPQAAEGGAAARLAVLDQRFVEVKAELAHLQAELQRGTHAALQDALEQVRELRARLDAAPAARTAAPPRTAPRLLEEIGALLSTLRPDLVLLRDSLVVAVGDFRSRTGFYRAVQDLPLSGGRPDGWKALRGAERWWERHVSTGQDDGGRAYARFDAPARRWSLLLGRKGEQVRDIDWLRRQI